MTPPALTARGVTKVFPGVVAVDQVDFDLMPGEVHALLGENGSGKTTLCKILTGLYQPEAGNVLVNGELAHFASPADAAAEGVLMVHQHFSLVDRMTVAENVVLGWSPRRRFVFNRREAETDVREAATRFGLDVDPRAPVWHLSAGERQRVEILKALFRGARTLILDEPTTVLTPQETTHLFDLVRRLVREGGSVVFISHKLEEVLALCDRVTVLRQGRVTGLVDFRERVSRGVDAKELARMMVGREITLGRRARRARLASGESPLEIRDLVVAGDLGGRAVNGASFELRPGEILGVAGVAGNGQRELAEAIFGLRTPESGSVRLLGRVLRPGDPRSAIEAGLGYVPEDRMRVGLAPSLGVGANLILKSLDSSDFTRHGFLRRRAIDAHTAGLVESFRIKAHASATVSELSGGNAQKVVLARELSAGPRALIAAAPTRGLDIAATAAVRSLLADAAETGIGVLLISEELDELLDCTDRIAVMCRGEITGIVDTSEADVEQIGLLMMGQTEQAAGS
jgi:general nucleoside transport system ATP-binding protein